MLPTNEFKFDIDVIGEESKKHYKGEFTYKRLSLNGRRQSDILRTKLSEGMDMSQLPEDVAIFNMMIAQLRYGLISYPKWWSDEVGFGLNDSFYDMNLISKLYNQCNEFETKWEEEVYGEESKGA